MKKILVFFITFIFILNSQQLFAEDSLTVKQQPDRLIQEVKDLNKAVFNKSFNKDQLYSNEDNEDNEDVEKFSSIDIRIYDLEKDIKNLTLQFEETIFKLDDISKKLNLIENELNRTAEQIRNESNNSNIVEDISENKNEVFEIKEENSLGKLIISNDEAKKVDNNSDNLTSENNTKISQKKSENLSPEELLQFALDQMMKKNYEKSKEILEDFIKDYPENQLSGSAHYWLGKIYLFESDYRRAAIVFGEGVQKFPKSIKAPEMYYELSKSLKEMNKNNEACKTLSLLEKNYKGNKYSKDPEKLKEALNCNNEN